MKQILTVFLLLMLTACGLLPEVQDETKGWSAQKLYAAAKEEMNDSNFEKAIQYFEKLEARYPYGRFAQQAQLEVTYAYYKSGESASALAAADRFIKLHPNHPYVDYAYYLKGLINFNDNTGLLSSVVEQDLSDRDPKAARESFEAFKELVTRFPNSKYAPDSAARMNYLVNALASHDVRVASYYVRRGAFVAAANRAQSVVKNFPQTPAREEALAIMVRSYDTLGLTDLRDDAKRVLKLNFPESKYLAGYKPFEKPWWKPW